MRLRPARPVALIAIGALLLSAAAATTASAEVPADPLVSVQPVATTLGDVNSASIVDGPFQMVVQVENAGASDITLIPDLPSWNYFPTAPPQTVPGGTCPVTCRVSWTIDPASQATPWYEGFLHLGVSAIMDDRSLTTYGTGVYYRPTVASTWAGIVADPTANTPGYGADMVDTGGTVTFSGMRGRSPGEQVLVSVLPPADNTDSSTYEYGMPPLATATGTWQTDPDTGYATGTVHLDTGALPEGVYRLVAQAHDGDGHYSYTTPAGIAVRHSPVLRLEPGGTGQVATGREIGMKLYLQNPRVNTKALGAVRLSVGGSTTTLSADPYEWYVPRAYLQPSERLITVPTAGLPLGPTQVGVEVLDVDGAPVASGATSIDVVDFHDVATIPTLVVGKAAVLHLSATAPAGTTFLQCAFRLTTAVDAYEDYNMCPGPKATSVTGTSTFYPTVAGPATVREEILMNDDVVGPLRDFPVTVYANRTASVSAPSKAAYNTTQTATVTVKDEKKRGVVSAAGSGVTVTLQRKKAGTTTWTTISTGTTGSTGVASLKYTNTASGRLRALVKGAVPSSTVTTAERAVTSVATVAWSYLPTTARSGATVTGSVYAKPYEKGATVRFQARKYGATTWTTFGSGTVGTSGYAKAGGRLYSRGTWEVRIQRVGTTAQATGYSSIRRVRIS